MKKKDTYSMHEKLIFETETFTILDLIMEYF